MGYLSIDNLYKNQDILMFKECFALEKIHGTSANISCKNNKIHFYSGGANHKQFVELFDVDKLMKKFWGMADVVVYGEAYGGKMMGMRDVYGDNLKFVVFDVKIDDMWLSVPQAEGFAGEIELEFVDYVKTTTDLESLDKERDRESVQAIRNGMGNGKDREGVILRPLIELTKNNGKRIIAKYKREQFRETKTPRKVDPERLKVLTNAKEVADDWVTEMRIVHVLDKIPNPCMEKMPDIFKAMVADIKKESEGEIEWSKEVSKAITRATAAGVKKYFQKRLENV